MKVLEEELEANISLYFRLLRVRTAVAKRIRGRILGSQIKGRLKLTDVESISLANIGKKLGGRALEEVANIVKPETFLAWHHRGVTKKFDDSIKRKYRGRPRVDPDIEELVIALAKDNHPWGYDRIVGALKQLETEISDQTIGMILK